MSFMAPKKFDQGQIWNYIYVHVGTVAAGLGRGGLKINQASKMFFSVVKNG